MKLFFRIMSYLITALAACALTLLWVVNFGLPGVSKLDELQALIGTFFIGEYDETLMEDAAAAAMVASLGDRWSYYIPAANYAAHVESANNAYVGIGITIMQDEESDFFRIVSVAKNGSAEAEGILPGDLLISASGQSTAGLTVNDISTLIRGEEGTRVTVGIQRDGVELEFRPERRTILVDVAVGEMLDDRIGLVTIANFDSRCAQESIEAIEALLAQGAQALIFDVRFNGGGYADELVKLLDYLLPEGDLFRAVDYSGKETVDRSDAAFLDLPIAVLCNGESYSAAEFFAAAIQEYGAGTIVGTPTVGKGYFQYTFPMTDGSATGLSVGKYYTPNGSSLIGTGIQPDILIELDDETYTALRYGTLEQQNDPQLQAAMEALGK